MSDRLKGVQVLGLDLRNFTQGKVRVLAPTGVGRTSLAEVDHAVDDRDQDLNEPKRSSSA